MHLLSRLGKNSLIFPPSVHWKWLFVAEKYFIVDLQLIWLKFNYSRKFCLQWVDTQHIQQKAANIFLIVFSSSITYLTKAIRNFRNNNQYEFLESSPKYHLTFFWKNFWCSIRPGFFCMCCLNRSPLYTYILSNAMKTFICITKFYFLYPTRNLHLLFIYKVFRFTVF